MLEALPTVAVGTSRLVERDALATFLERIQEGGDVAEVRERVRAEKNSASRKHLRNLVQKDHAPASLALLPEAVTLSRGRLEVNFRSLEELAGAMYFLARALDGDLEAFALQYEPQRKPSEEPDQEEVDKLFRELAEVESGLMTVRS